MVSMQWIAVEAIKPNARNARTHSKKQIRQIADSIAAFGFLVPILTDQGDRIIAGHGRYAAAVLLGLQEVPVIQVEGLSEAKRRALALADNKIAENAGWDRELLATELPELADILIVEGLDLSITGFCAGRDRSNRHRLRGRSVRSRRHGRSGMDQGSSPEHTWRSLAVGPSPSVLRRRPQCRRRCWPTRAIPRGDGLSRPALQCPRA